MNGVVSSWVELSLTALLLPLVLVMAWRCWNLPPVPATRFWALAFGGMSAGMLAQMWRAELWKSRCHKLLPPGASTTAPIAATPATLAQDKSHVERAFLTVRQELKRFERKTLGYSKSLEMHKLAVALHFGVYNFVRQHHTLGTTPAVAAGLEEKEWSLEQILDMTADYMRRKVET